MFPFMQSFVYTIASIGPFVLSNASPTSTDIIIGIMIASTWHPGEGLRESPGLRAPSRLKCTGVP